MRENLSSYLGRKDELDGVAVQDATTSFLERLLVKPTRIVSVSCDFLLNPTSIGGRLGVLWGI